MQQDHIIIRRETPADYAAVEHLTREAFWNVYRPGCLEHYVLHVLRGTRTRAGTGPGQERDGELSAMCCICAPRSWPTTVGKSP